MILALITFVVGLLSGGGCATWVAAQRQANREKRERKKLTAPGSWSVLVEATDGGAHVVAAKGKQMQIMARVAYDRTGSKNPEVPYTDQLARTIDRVRGTVEKMNDTEMANL